MHFAAVVHAPFIAALSGVSYLFYATILVDTFERPLKLFLESDQHRSVSLSVLLWRLRGRIIHCAGCTMGAPSPSSQGGPRRSAAKFLSRCFDVWTLSVRLNVTTTKKGRHLFGGKKCTATDRKTLASRTRKGPPPYVGMGPPNG